jgi:hypothetical protein
MPQEQIGNGEAAHRQPGSRSSGQMRFIPLNRVGTTVLEGASAAATQAVAGNRGGRGQVE